MCYWRVPLILALIASYRQYVAVWLWGCTITHNRSHNNTMCDWIGTDPGPAVPDATELLHKLQTEMRWTAETILFITILRFTSLVFIACLCETHGAKCLVLLDVRVSARCQYVYWTLRTRLSTLYSVAVLLSLASRVSRPCCDACLYNGARVTGTACPRAPHPDLHGRFISASPESARRTSGFNGSIIFLLLRWVS